MAKTRVAVTASGVMDVIPGRPFQILIAYFSERLTHLPKHMLVAIVAGTPQSVVNLTSTDGKIVKWSDPTKHGTPDAINAVNYKSAKIALSKLNFTKRCKLQTPTDSRKTGVMNLISPQNMSSIETT